METHGNRDRPGVSDPTEAPTVGLDDYFVKARRWQDDVGQNDENIMVHRFDIVLPSIILPTEFDLNNGTDEL